MRTVKEEGVYMFRASTEAGKEVSEQLFNAAFAY